MKRKESTFLSVLGMALLVTVMTTLLSLAAPALALGQFNTPSGSADFSGLPTNKKTNDLGGLDKDHSSGYDTLLDGTNSAISGFPANNEVGNTDGATAEDEGAIENSKDSTDSDSYKDFQGCLSDAEGREGSPTEQDVQGCVELSYSGLDSNENSPTDSTDEDENGVNEDVSTDEEVENGEE
jgi:hypothetical protein